MPRIKRRFLDGMIISSDKLDTVCFTPRKDFFGKPIEADYDFEKRILQITYTPDATNFDLNRLKEFEIVNMELLSPLDGCFELMNTLIVNNVEYIQGEIPIREFNQYLVDDSKVDESGMATKEGVAIVIIKGSDLQNYYSDEPNKEGFTDYCKFINQYDSFYARQLTSDKVELINIYSGFFSGERLTCSDQSIAGTVEDFAVNDVKAFSAFIHTLRKEFPSIQFYNNPEEKDSTHYNEWVNYKMTPRGTTGVLFSNHVLDSPVHGRYWPSTINFTLEYSAVDLPTVMTRRDQQQSELFLNKVCYYFVKLKRAYRKETFDLRCALYWDRTDLTDDHTKETEQDESGYSLNSWKMTGKIIFMNIEKRTQTVFPFHTAIFDVYTDDKYRNHVHGEDHVEPEYPPEEETVGETEEEKGLIL